MSEFLILKSWSQAKGFRFKYIVFFLFLLFIEKRKKNIWAEGGGGVVGGVHIELEVG